MAINYGAGSDAGSTVFRPGAGMTQTQPVARSPVPFAGQQTPQQGQGGQPGQFGPAPWQQFGGVPYINPNDPSGWVQQYSQLLAQSQLPYLQSAIQGSNADYASSGLLYGGAAASAADQLRASYLASIAGGTAPLVSNAMNFQQADTMANAGAYGQVVGSNMNAYNNYQNELFNAYMGSYGQPSAAAGVYSGATGPLGSTYGDVYGSTQQGINSLWGSIFGAAGQVAAAGTSPG